MIKLESDLKETFGSTRVNLNWNFDFENYLNSNSDMRIFDSSVICCYLNYIVLTISFLCFARLCRYHPI